MPKYLLVIVNILIALIYVNPVILLFLIIMRLSDKTLFTIFSDFLLSPKITIRMKRILLLFVCLCFVSISLAQNFVGVRGGFCGSFLGGDYTNVRPVFGCMGGIVFNRQFRCDRLSLAPAIDYYEKGGKMNVDKYGYRFHYAIRYLELSVPMSVRFNVSDNLRMFCSVGFYGSRALNGEYECKEYNLSGDLFEDESLSIYDFGSRTDAGIEWNRFSLAVSVSYGLLSIFEEYQESCSIRTRSFALVVGYRIASWNRKNAEEFINGTTNF